jgi:hypothetical protein
VIYSASVFDMLSDVGFLVDKERTGGGGGYDEGEMLG